MKSSKFFLLSAALIMSVVAYSQTDSTWQTEDSLQTGQTEKNYQTFPAPNFGIHYIGILGNYASSANYTSSPENSSEQKNLTITGDEENPGKIWIEGLTNEKIYAVRKKEPGTYKVQAQNSGDKKIQEGTVIYDDSTKEINICLGCKFNDENPSDAFAQTENNGSKKSSVINFTGIKADAGTAAVKQ